MLTPEQREEIQRRAVLGDHRAAWYLSDRAEIAQELVSIIDNEHEMNMPAKIRALIERIK